MPLNDEILKALIISVPGLIALGLQFKREKKQAVQEKDNAAVQNSKTVMEMTMTLIDPLKEQIKESILKQVQYI